VPFRRVYVERRILIDGSQTSELWRIPWTVGTFVIDRGSLVALTVRPALDTGAKFDRHGGRDRKVHADNEMLGVPG